MYRNIELQFVELKYQEESQYISNQYYHLV